MQLALENATAKTQLAAQNAQAANKATPSNAEADPNQNIVNNLSVLSEQLPSEGGSTESSDKSFSGLIGEGLKDVKAPPVTRASTTLPIASLRSARPRNPYVQRRHRLRP